MASYNRIIMVGNLTRDPDYKQLASGQAVCRLSLASNRQFKNKQSGNMVQEVCYIDVDVWGAQAESCRQYLQKGRPVLVEGRLKLDSWQDPEGKTRSKHGIVAERVVFLGSNQAVEGEEEVAATAKEVEPQIDPALAEQINKAKSRVKAKKAEAAPVSFQDEPPFQDDLPF